MIYTVKATDKVIHELEATKIIIPSGVSVKLTNYLCPEIEVQEGATLEVEGGFSYGFKDHIYSKGNNTSMIIHNVKAIGTPHKTKGEITGRFVNVFKAKHVEVTNCELTATRGIKIREGDGIKVRILRNVANGINGAFSDGANGYYNRFENRKEIPGVRAQFVSLRKTKNADAIICLNKVFNRVGDQPIFKQEDIINLNTDGADVYDNLIVGSYPYNVFTEEHSGTGIITDGSFNQNINIRGNYVIGTANVGISVHDGDHIIVSKNTVLSAGRLPAGKFRYSKVGLSDQFNSGPYVEWINNRTGWMNTTEKSEPFRKDLNFKSVSKESGTEILQPGETITFEDEEAMIKEYNLLHEDVVFGLISEQQTEPLPQQPETKTLMIEEYNELIRMREDYADLMNGLKVVKRHIDQYE